MSDAAFTHDVFLSHSAKDKAVVRELAERLQKDGLKVCFEKPEMGNPNLEIRDKSESPNERKPKRAARHPTLILPVYPIGEFGLVSDFGFRDSDLKFGPPGLSAHAFGSDWAQLEAGTCGRVNLPFRDPLNQERRFIPLRLDDAPIKSSGSKTSATPVTGWRRPSRCCW